MLNYVWIALIILGLAAAVSSDLSDDFSDKYKTGKHIPISLTKTESQPGKTSINGVITKKNYKSIFGESYPNDISFSIKGEIPASDKSSKITIILRDNIPPLLKTAAKNSGDENDLSAQLFIKDKNNLTGTIVLEKVSFTKMKEVTNSALSYADTAVTVALGLIGIMALWLGIMKIADASGIVNNIAKALKPLMRFLFPDIPPDHPAMGSIVMNLAASVLGLGNAATPFGIKAMEDMNTLNPNKGIATNAMCTFLVLNTSGFALMPSTAIALRAASGSSEPAIIIGTTMFGSFTGTVIGVLFVKLIENFTVSKSEILHKIISKYKLIATIIFGVIAIITLGKLGLLSSIASVFSFMSIDLLRSTIQSISTLAIPAMIFAFVAFGMIKKVKVYETFIEGAKEGFTIAVSIIPYLVAILMAIGIFRTGGAMNWLIYILDPVTSLIGMPTEALPMVLMRPLSGSGSLGIMAEIFTVHGPDSFIGILVSTIYGSTETTFFVLAVYFGAINIKNTRHALPAGLIADLAGTLGALFIVRLLFA